MHMSKGNRAVAFDQALEQARKEAIIQTLRDSPDMTLGEIRKLDPSIRDLVELITIGELQAAAKASPRKKSTANQNFATRTTAGREQIDEAVLTALRAAGEPVRAEALRPKVGCSPAQLRRSLARLVAAKVLKRSGQARATTYQLRRR